MVSFESLGMVSYLLSIVTMAISLAISQIFSIKVWPWSLRLGSFKVI